MIILIFLTMLSLFVVNQAQLLAKTPAMSDRRSAAVASETMFTANEFYEMGQFAQAAQVYQQLVDQGFTDSALFYNLGNAYFKQTDYGRAILNYRRAQQLAPRDADIKANLNLARAQTVDQLETEDNARFLTRLGQLVQGWLTVNELAMAALGTWILFMLILILYGSTRAGSARRKGLQYALVATGLVLVVGILALGSSLYMANNHSEGVIVASKVDITSGPGSHYLTEFMLHSGAEVNLVETRGNWVRLALPGSELGGWVPNTAVGALPSLPSS
jgi:tetratricopeptide (TPR) repeat protein